MNAIDAFKDAIEGGHAKAARETAELSQADVAEMLGISPAAISRWESGNRIPREDLAAMYLAAIGISLQGDDGDEECPPGQHKMPDGTCMNDEDMEKSRYEISGTAVMEGVWTGDGRQFKLDGLSWPDPVETNIPLQWQKESSHGGDHDVTVNVGRVMSIERVGDRVNVTGVVDDGSDDGKEVVRRMTDDPPTLAGVSIVADDPEQGEIEIAFDGDQPVGVIFHTGRIRALTLVDIPAFVEGAITITASAQPETFVSEEPWNGAASRFTDEQYRMSAAGCDPGRGETAKEQCFLPHHEPGGAVSRAGVHAAAGRVNQTQASAESISRAKSHLRGHYTRDLKEEPPESLNSEVTTMTDDGLEDLRTIIAAATTIEITDAPPKEWFDEPTELPAAGAITVTDDGRIFGLLAPKDVAHRAFKKGRVEVPTGNVDYSRWMNRETITADGTRVKTGPITMQCGHASTDPIFRLNANNAVQHYDNSCSVFATARIGENAHGVWIAGALLPDVDKPKVARAMMCQLSGDWQEHRESPGMREFVAALLVPVPGFPVGDSDPSLRMSEGLLVASAAPVTWFASGGIPDDETGDSDAETEVTTEVEAETATETDESETETEANPGGVLADLPSPDEAKEAKRTEARARIKEMRAELGLDDTDDDKEE